MRSEKCKSAIVERVRWDEKLPLWDSLPAIRYCCCSRATRAFRAVSNIFVLLRLLGLFRVLLACSCPLLQWVAAHHVGNGHQKPCSSSWSVRTALVVW